MRYRSLNNSRNYENSDLAADYRRDWNCDEIAYLFPEDGRMARIPCQPTPTYISQRYEPACHLHHICRRILGTQRWDITTNLVSLCKWTHLFVHGVYADDGLILCVKAKLDKREWDWSEIERITHLPNFRDWMSLLEPKCDWVLPILDSVLAERQAA